MKKQCHINYMKKTHNCTPPNFYIMLERKRESQNGKTPIKAHNKHCEMQGVHLSFSVIIIHQCFYNFVLSMYSDMLSVIQFPAKLTSHFLLNSSGFFTFIFHFLRSPFFFHFLSDYAFLNNYMFLWKL